MDKYIRFNNKHFCLPKKKKLGIKKFERMLNVNDIMSS